MGRSVPGRTLSELLVKLWNAIPRPHAHLAKNERLLQDMDFTEALEGFGIVLHSEKADLKCFLMEVGHGAVDLRALAAFLKDMEFRFEPSSELMKRAASELGSGGTGNTIIVRSTETLEKL